ncbi:MAG: transcriptional regulator [Chloroflexi bacterium]|nr:transcriptional regulator [Chloroflexota bacterium]|tara:strand:+ start:570 stop:866 length:297 start_codon:yes stop_codon:yes gene_type:complete
MDISEDELFKALSDRTRRLIIDELLERDQQSLFEVCTRLISLHDVGISRQGISRHLQVLENVGVIEVKWQGNTKIHSLNSTTLSGLSQGWLSKFEVED